MADPLARLDKARIMLAGCRTLPEIKQIRGQAEAVRCYAKAAHMGRAMLNYAGEIKLLADHKAGELLKQLQRKPGQRTDRPAASVAGGSEYAQVLKETETPERTAQYWQRVAEVPESVLHRYVAEVTGTEDAEVTTKGLFSFHSSKAVQLTSDCNEYYTLSEHIEAARDVLGCIDLDPASCEAANGIVKAKRYFTISEDGLAKNWTGRVWMNPPWGEAGPLFVRKLLNSYAEGTVAAAVLLVNAHATDAKWFQPLWDFTLCFTAPRIRFWQPEDKQSSPNAGTVFVYFGPDKDTFDTVFSRYGAIAERRKR
jgi:hypothetical protein